VYSSKLPASASALMYSRSQGFTFGSATFLTVRFTSKVGVRASGFALPATAADPLPSTVAVAAKPAKVSCPYLTTFVMLVIRPSISVAWSAS
jgi:hypothetical protein